MPSRLPPMRPELELMLRCARNWPDEAADARIRELVEGAIDWDFLLRIADRHRMKPFLYWNLKSTAKGNVPASVWEQLETRFMANARGNMLSMGRMLRLLAQFEEARIPVIAFKGPVSTYHLYGTPGLREFTDLDVLVDAGVKCPGIAGEGVPWWFMACPSCGSWSLRW